MPGASYSEAYAASHGRFAVIPAAYVFLRRREEVLLQLREGTGYYDGYWAAGAAGHLEAGESILAAAAREAREELGVEILIDDLHPVTTMHRTASDAAIDQRMDVFFTVFAWEGEPVLQEPKATDLRWFALDALPTKVVPHERAVLELLLGGAVPAVITFGF